MSDAELLAPVAPGEEAPPPEAPVEAAPVSEDADIDKIVDEQGVDLPNEKLVPLAAVENARAKLKTVRAELETAKQGSAKASELEGQIAQLQQRLASVEPYAQAYQAAIQAQQAPPEPTGPTAEERAELEEIARDNDYYKTDGTLDFDRAQRMQARINKAAQKIAGQAVAPIHQQTQSDRSTAMLHSAKLTTAPDGSKPSPEILDWVWSKIDPSVTSTKEGAQQAFAAAMGYAALLGKTVKATSAAPREAIPPPILTERSGGREHTGPTLSESDKRAARELGVSEKEYAEEVAKMPWGRR